MRINNNISALNAHRNLSITDNVLSKSLEKLSSGLRINRAADDAAGLAISEKMRGQIRGLQQAVRNAQDGISLLQTAEGALNETHAILQRMRELAVQASSDTNTDADRTELNREVEQLTREIERIAQNTEFNSKKLLNGDMTTTSARIHIGANAGQYLSVTIASMGARALNLGTGSGDSLTVTISVATRTGASTAIGTIDAALNIVSTERSKIGALQNRLEHTIKNLSVAAENLQAAESRIRDVDMAAEMAAFTRSQILLQAGTAMMAQANAKPQSVLQLLG